MAVSGTRRGSGGRLRVVVLYGGASAEHEVSCLSARTVLRALDGDRYQVEVVGIGTDGRWVRATDAVSGLAAANPSLPEPDALLAQGEQAVEPLALVAATAPTRPEPGAPVPGGSVPHVPVPTVVWPVLHGPLGEDGTVQGLLELAGVAYVGAGVAGSAAAMDKGLAKTAFAGAGIPQARWFGLRADSVLGPRTGTGTLDVPVTASTAGTGPTEPSGSGLVGLAKTIEADLGWPVFVKPANMGSSVGVHRATGIDELDTAVRDAASFDDYLVIEEEIVGRELEIAVLGIDPLRVSRPGEIIPTHGTYDYEDKYIAGTARLEIPADVPEDVADEMGILAVEACRALRVDAMARVDFFYQAGTGRLLVNEINTLPGFTAISMYPALWEATGLPIADLADELVRLALVRRATRSQRRTSR